MTLHRPFYMQAAEGDDTFEYSANDFRRLLGLLFNTEGVGNTNGADQFTNNDLKVVQRAAGANMSVDVLGGWAVILGDDVSRQGFYAVFSDDRENLVIPAAPVSGSRVHRVIARVKDKLHDGTQDDYEWILEVLEDTDGGGPPDVPDSAISLATVTVDQGDTSVLNAAITDTRESVVMGSGMTAGRYVSSSSLRPANPRTSEIVYRTDRAGWEFWDGSAWREIASRDGGGEAWTTYTPVLTATSSNPNMGSTATRQGRYIRYGRMVTVEVSLRFGGTGVSAGNGFYEVSLPVTARSQSIGRRTGSAYTWDNSAGSGDFADGVCFINSGETDKVRLSIDSNVVSHSVPWTWAANDELGFTITYEAAS